MIKYVITPFQDLDGDPYGDCLAWNLLPARNGRWYKLETIPNAILNNDIGVIQIDLTDSELATLEASADVHVVDEVKMAQGDVTAAVAFMEAKGARRPDFAADRANMSMAQEWVNATALVEAQLSDV